MKVGWSLGAGRGGGLFKACTYASRKTYPPGSPQGALSGSDLWVIFNPGIGLHTAFIPQSEQLWKAAACVGRSWHERAKQLIFRSG